MTTSELDNLPIYLKPKLRLFLSADLVGSTAFKQRPAYPLQMEDSDPAVLPGPRWLATITNFYAAFGSEFSLQWNEFHVKSKQGHQWPTGPEPIFWKGIGDEVVYVKELHDPKEVSGTIWVWMQALKKYRADLKAKIPGLDIKSTVWIGGFPLNNSEVVFDMALETQGASPDDPQLSHFQKLDEYYKSGQNHNKFVLDFIGTSVDTGFRLSTKAAPRRMMASIEVVLMITSTPIPDHKFGPMKVYFEGYQSFKGVLGGKPYPLFWIDVFAGTDDEQLAKAEDDLMNRHPGEEAKLRIFCEDFIERNGQHLIRPFIHNCPEQSFRTLPKLYAEKLLEWHKKIEKESSRYRTEAGLNEPADVAAGSRPAKKDVGKILSKGKILSELKAGTIGNAARSVASKSGKNAVRRGAKKKLKNKSPRKTAKRNT